MISKRWIALALAGAVLALAAGAAIAQDGEEKQENNKKGKDAYKNLFLKSLADELGIGQARLVAAGKAAAEDVIAQAVKDGRLSKEEAGRLRKRLADAESFPVDMSFLKGWHKEGHRMMGLGRYKNAAIDAAAKRRGMTREELTSQLRSGKSLAEVAAGKRVTKEQLGKAIADAVKPILDKAVADGKLSRERADAVLKRLRSGDLTLFNKHRATRKAA